MPQAAPILFTVVKIISRERTAELGQVNVRGCFDLFLCICGAHKAECAVRDRCGRDLGVRQDLQRDGSFSDSSDICFSFADSFFCLDQIFCCGFRMVFQSCRTDKQSCLSIAVETVGGFQQVVYCIGTDGIVLHFCGGQSRFRSNDDGIFISQQQTLRIGGTGKVFDRSRFQSVFSKRIEHNRGIDGVLTEEVDGGAVDVFQCKISLLRGDIEVAPGHDSSQFIVGFTGFIAAFYGMTAGLGSFRERSQSYAMSKAGTLLGGLMVAVWFIVFCIGLAQ